MGSRMNRVGIGERRKGRMAGERDDHARRPVIAFPLSSPSHEAMLSLRPFTRARAPGPGRESQGVGHARWEIEREF